MHVTFLSTYPPRACGLATFTRDLRSAVIGATPGLTADVVSVVHERGPQRPEVTVQLRQQERDDYGAAAAYLNGSGTDVLSVQHEFGIFAGSEGEWVLDTMRGLNRPVVTTLHTVLPSPPAHYLRATRDVVAASDRVVVMSETARQILVDVYGADPERIAVVLHGAPDLDPTPPPGLKASLGLEGRTVLLTFGMLGPGKGIEFALEALPDVVAQCPDVLYVVLGATHPEIVRREGEAYRDRLLDDVVARGLGDHVRFVDQYADLDTIWTYLQAADVYVSPYPGMDQIVSGTLAYALSAGKAIVSTPYLPAAEALADGRGRLVPYGDVAGFSAAIAGLAASPAERERLAAAALAYGQQAAWPNVGMAYARIFAEAVEAAGARRFVAPAPTLALHPGELPKALDYLRELTDDTGIIQHAAYGVPDRAHGYSTDDVARALAVVLRAARALPRDPALQEQARRLTRTYLAFLHHAQLPSGPFHNFMGYDRRFLDDVGSEDTTGRTLWGLGAAVAGVPSEPVRRHALDLFERGMHVELTHPRALSYAATGLYHVLRAVPGHDGVRARLTATAETLAGYYDGHARDGWRWFSDRLTYANARLPHAMLLAADALGSDRFRRIGLDTLQFLADVSFRAGYFDAVGNQGWWPREQPPAPFDQQPIEAGYMADACRAAWKATGDRVWVERAVTAAEWFHGRNRIGTPLFDVETGGCADGFGPHGLNLNQGAESAIACALAFLAVEELRATGALLPATPAAAPPERTSGDGGLRPPVATLRP